MAAAVGWRIAPPDDPQAAAELLGRELMALYLHYIDDHTARLTALGQVDLAAAFIRWRDHLVA